MARLCCISWPHSSQVEVEAKRSQEVGLSFAFVGKWNVFSFGKYGDLPCAETCRPQVAILTDEVTRDYCRSLDRSFPAQLGAGVGLGLVMQLNWDFFGSVGLAITRIEVIKSYEHCSLLVLDLRCVTVTDTNQLLVWPSYTAAQ